MKNAHKAVWAVSTTFPLLLAATAAHAEGVPAGTLIENTATASYTDAGGRKTVDSNTAVVQVDELLDVVIASQDSGAVSIGTGSEVLTFEITNTGNGPEAFVLTADPAVSGNDFDVTVDAIAYDTNGNGVYDAGIDTILAPGDATPEIAADAALTIFLLVTSPPGVTDGQTSQVNLLAEAETGTGVPGTSFPGLGFGGGNAVVGTTNADADTDGALVVSLASLALVKSASVADPFGGTEAVPGSTITYSIVATVSGTSTLTALRITDAIPAGATYLAGTLALDSAALTDADDTDAGKADDTNGIDVLLGDVPGGTAHTITFDVSID